MKTVIETENYAYDNGLYKALFRIYIPYGRGLEITTNEARALFRPTQLEGCEVMIFKKSGNLTHSQWVSYLGDTSKKGDVEDELDGARSKDDLRQNIIKSTPLDYNSYEKLKSDETATLPQYKWSLVIFAETLEKLERQIEQIQMDYHEGEAKEFTKWVILIPAIATTYNDIKAIVGESLDHNDNKSDTNTHRGYSGLDFYETTTLQDRLGTPIGQDIYSSETVVGTQRKRARVVVDFERNVESKAIIAYPKSMSLESYRLSPTEKEPQGVVAPFASVIGQAIANQLTVEGRRVVHYNLNGYSYDRLENATEFIDKPEFYQKINLEDVVVNALQPFGPKSQERYFYESFQKKIILLFNIAREMTLTKSDKIKITAAVVEAYSAYWDKNPVFRNLMQVKSELFIQLSDVLDKLNREDEVAEAKGNYERSDQFSDLYTSLSNAIEESRVFAQRTKFVMPETAELVLDCYGLSQKMALLQLVNTINFVIYNLSKGDAIFIHGTNLIPPEVFSSYLNSELEIAKNKGIRIFFLFDTTFAKEELSIEDYKGVLYKNFDKDFETHIIGYIPPEMFSIVENLYNNKFNIQMKNDMTTDLVDARALLRRHKTKDSIMFDGGDLLI